MSNFCTVIYHIRIYLIFLHNLHKSDVKLFDQDMIVLVFSKILIFLILYQTTKTTIMKIINLDLNPILTCT